MAYTVNNQIPKGIFPLRFSSLNTMNQTQHIKSKSAILHRDSSMDSRQRLLVLALLTIVVALSVIPSSAAAAASVRSSPDDKVKLALYYETLCPYCSNFIVNYLYKIFENGLIDIVDLKLSPYGNAKIGPNNTIICQVLILLLFSLSFSILEFLDC